MSSDAPAPAPTAAQRRKFGLLALSLGVAVAVIVVGLVALNHQLWMLAFLVFTIPNFYMGVRELRASRNQQL